MLFMVGNLTQSLGLSKGWLKVEPAGTLRLQFHAYMSAGRGRIVGC